MKPELKQATREYLQSVGIYDSAIHAHIWIWLQVQKWIEYNEKIPTVKETAQKFLTLLSENLP